MVGLDPTIHAVPKAQSVVMVDIDAQKAALRTEMRHRRTTALPSAGPHLAANLLTSHLIHPHAIVAAFLPLPGEIDTAPTLAALIRHGHTVLLPVTPPRGHPLTFREWHPGMPLRPGRYGTHHTDGHPGTPTVILVPLLAFDAHCNRLGYGAGYYDRTIAALAPVRTIGLAYAFQQVDAVPVMPHDVPLDAVVTETAIHIRPTT